MKRFVLVAFVISLLLIPFLHFSLPIRAEEIASVSYAQIKRHKPHVSKPDYIKIPTVKIHASIEELSVIDGVMENPTGIEKAGWYTQSVKPGSKGNSVIAGHLDDEDGNPAIFGKLHQAKIGDELTVGDKVGNTFTYTIRDIKEYLSSRLPLATFFTNSRESNLILITCSGVFDSKQDTYTNRLVVFATLQES